MKITRLHLNNVRGYVDHPPINFSRKINVIVGANNSGKSTILNSIFLLQRHGVLGANDITIGSTNGHIDFFYEGNHLPNIEFDGEGAYLRYFLSNNSMRLIMLNESATHGVGPIPEQEPHNLIYPYLSKRKSVDFSNAITEENANSVTGNFQNLASKIDRISTKEFQPANSEYVKACHDILGFEISTLAKGNGKQAVLFVKNLEHIPLPSMGEGVSNVIALIADLCMAENKIFIIEEPENDIHPKALKSLLQLIINKSERNQFFISTHSNIVVKHLGGVEGTKVFEVTNDDHDIERPKLALSKIKEVPQELSERRRVLENLGYDYFDYDLWAGWIFLEEASAEVIIRDYLIKWFFPDLKLKLRTFSASSSSQIIPKFEDFNRLFVFLHLQPTYKNRVWVFIDSGDDETKIIDKLKSVYVNSGWNPLNFGQFSKHDFEEYYPEFFQAGVKRVLSIDNIQSKREEKRILLDNVKSWIHGNEETAMQEFKKSANEIIEILGLINQALNA